MWCNNWECSYNKDGNCDSAEGQTKCNEELLRSISRLISEHKEKNNGTN